MTRSPEEPRSSLSVGVQWASRVSTVGLMFVAPALGGHLLDRWLKSSPWALLAGAVLGFAVGMMSILRIAREGTGGGSGQIKG